MRKKAESVVGGWKRLDSETVYENPWIKVTHENVVTPAGTDGIYGVVHFKNTAVGVVPIDENGYTWLVGQSRYVLGEYSWEIPEGGAPEGELPMDAAKRELEEETGLIADEWGLLAKVHQSNSICNEVGYVYTAKVLSAGLQQLEETEDIQLRHLPLKSAIDMVLRGEITDSMSVSGLLKLGIIMGLGEFEE